MQSPVLNQRVSSPKYTSPIDLNFLDDDDMFFDPNQVKQKHNTINKAGASNQETRQRLESEEWEEVHPLYSQNDYLNSIFSNNLQFQRPSNSVLLLFNF